MKTIAIEKSFCTSREAATLLGVSVGTVQLWVESGLLKAWKTSGGHRRVIRDSINSLLQKSTVPFADPDGVAMTGPDTPEPVMAADAGRARPFGVLVVEDDENLLRLYQTMLSRWPMAPVISLANNAVTGLLMMGRSNPDMVITDLDMPGMDGFNMLRVLSKTPDMRHTRLVVVSGLDAAEIARRGGLPDGIAVFPKPIPFDRLLAIANNIVIAR